MDKIIVVGSGFSGSVLARKIAEELDRKVKVVEKRAQTGGNAYDEVDEHGILIHKYGPHFINTNNYTVIKYLEQYAELYPLAVHLLGFLDGRYVRLPYNFETIQQLIGPEKAESLLKKLRKAFYGRDRVPVLELANHMDPDISAYGNLLFEKAFRPYTSKQWGIPPEKVERYVLERTPLVMGYDSRYLNKDFQYLPVNGFAELFRNLLGHPNIELELNTDALDHLRLSDGMAWYDGDPVECLVYTGPIDELFGYKYGMLPYRSLDIRYHYEDKTSILPAQIVSFPQAEGYTRSTEYRKIMYDDSKVRGSVVATEYPLPYDLHAEVGNIPYYAVVTEESSTVYQKYLQEVKKYKNIFLCGRLAEFKYYNMDICIEHALEYFEDVKAYLLGGEHD